MTNLILIAAALFVTAAQAEWQRDGRWDVYHEVDPITDEVIAQATMYGYSSANQKPAYRNWLNERITLSQGVWISCVSGEWTLGIFFETEDGERMQPTEYNPFTGGDRALVDYRVHGKDPVLNSQNWRALSWGYGITGPEALQIIDQITTAENITLRFYGGLDNMTEALTVTVFMRGQLAGVIDRHFSGFGCEL